MNIKTVLVIGLGLMLGCLGGEGGPDSQTTADSLAVSQMSEASLTEHLHLSWDGIPDTTLVFSSGWHVSLARIDSVAMPEADRRATVWDSLARGITNQHLKARAYENWLLRDLSDKILRDSTALSLPLVNGNWISLVPDPASDEADHILDQYLEEQDFFIVRVQWGEGNGYKLIDARSGEVFSIGGRPAFSPDHKLLVTVNTDLEAQYSQNGFQLFKMNDRVPHLIGAYEPEGWGPVAVEWLSDSILVMRCTRMVPNRNGLAYVPFYFRVEVEYAEGE